ncbi:MAG: efflux transporter outer membrane subunit [Methylocystis sp.]
MKLHPFCGLLLTALLLCGCDLAPEYKPPAVETPAKFKEGGNWREARPRDDQPRGPWWQSFNDRVLNDLEQRIDTGNQDLAAALAVLEQSRAYVAKAQAGLMPTVDLNNSLSANKESQHRPFRKADTPFSANALAESILTDRPINEPDHYGDNVLKLQASYEVDLWGRVRDRIAAGQAQAQASAADLESMRLSLQAELARNYVAMRGLDSEAKLLGDTVNAYEKALALTQALVNGKIGAPADEARAAAQLEVARAQLMEIKARRALYEHAIATLIGEPASSFSIAPAPLAALAPKIPPGVPFELLERRPDIAAAERRVAAANQTIGVARAAFFPRLTINLSGGTEDTGLSLFNMRNSIWSLGPSVTLPIFDGGARLADLSAADAAYLQTVAQYRGAVLRAYQEVEDNLALTRWLAKETQSMTAARASAEKVLGISLTLYRDGATNYLDVVTAQTAALEAERAVLVLQTRKLQASVGLILALGGGWSTLEVAKVE